MYFWFNGRVCVSRGTTHLYLFFLFPSVSAISWNWSWCLFWNEVCHEQSHIGTCDWSLREGQRREEQLGFDEIPPLFSLFLAFSLCDIFVCFVGHFHFCVLPWYNYFGSLGDRCQVNVFREDSKSWYSNDHYWNEHCLCLSVWFLRTVHWWLFQISGGWGGGHVWRKSRGVSLRDVTKGSLWL